MQGPLNCGRGYLIELHSVQDPYNVVSLDRC